MSITQQLKQITEARFGRDVRQAIHDSIEESYNIAVQAEGKAVTAQNSAKAYSESAQASTQQAQTYRNQAEQFKNQAMAATPTGYENLVDKVNSIYRETASDFAIIGTSEGSALAHTIYGMSVQDGTPTPDNPIEFKSAKVDYTLEGKNLLEFPRVNEYRPMDYTAKGVHFVIDNDGIVTINCTNIVEESAINLINAYGTASGKYMQVGQKYRLGLDIISGTNPKLSDGKDGVYLGMVRLNKAGAATYGPTTLDATPVATATADKLKFGIRLVVRAGATITNLKVKPYFELGTTLLKTPYEKSKVTTDLTLRALEVTSSEGYNLEKNGKYYIADTIDWDEDRGYEITRRVGYVKLDGSENWTSPHAITETGDTYRKCYTNSIFPSYEDLGQTLTDSSKKGRIISNAYPECMTNGKLHPYTGAETIALHDTNHWIQIYDERYNKNDDMDAWKAHLAKEPLTIQFRLASPIKEAITPEQAQALLSLKTYDEATSIMPLGEAAPITELEYTKDRNTAVAFTGYNKAFINELKLAEMNAALVEISSS